MLFKRLIKTVSATRLVHTEIPKPTTSIKDVNSFLTKIGRKCNEVESVYENNWDSLFSWKSDVLKEKGVSVQQRKYILQQVENYNRGLEITEFKKGKKSFWGGERKRKETIAKWRAEQRAKEHEEFMKQHSA